MINWFKRKAKPLKLWEMPIDEYVKTQVNNVCVSGANCDFYLSASMPYGELSNGWPTSHLYFQRDGTWAEQSTNGLWKSLTELLHALRDAGFIEVKVNMTYIKSW